MERFGPGGPWRKPGLAALLALLGIGAAAALAHRRSPLDPKGGSPASPAMPFASRPALNRQAAPDSTEVLGTAQRDATDFDELLGLLDKVKDKPAAQSFAREFMKEPELKKAYESFRKDQQGPRVMTLEQFMLALNKRPELQGLLKKFSGDPGFRQVVPHFMVSPAVRSAVHQELARLRADARSRSWRSASDRAGAGGERPPQGRGGRGAGASQGLLADARAGAVPRAGGRSSPPQGSAAEAAGSEESDDPARTLAALASAGPGRDAAKALASLCFKGDPSISKEECRAIEKFLGDNDLWEACVKADMHAKCQELCAQKPELNCGQVPGVTEVCLGCGAACADTPACEAAFAPAGGPDGGDIDGGGADDNPANPCTRVTSEGCACGKVRRNGKCEWSGQLKLECEAKSNATQTCRWKGGGVCDCKATKIGFW